MLKKKIFFSLEVAVEAHGPALFLPGTREKQGERP